MQHLKNYFAFLEKFRNENKILKTQPDANRAVFIGDSIIAGWNEHELFTKNKNFINRGINGQTSTQILIRFTADVLDLKPKCIVVLVGTNDIAENNGPVTLEKIQHNFLTMTELAKARKCSLILCSILPVGHYYWNKKIVPMPKIKVLNEFLTSLADNKTVFFLDLFVALEKDNQLNPHFTTDGVHPNVAGYDIMSKLLLQSHQELLNL